MKSHTPDTHTAAASAPQTIFSSHRSKIRAARNLARWQKMHNSDARGIDVLYDDSGAKPFGLGLIEFPPCGEVQLHVHEGSHILVCLAGDGVLKVQVEGPDSPKRLASHTISVGQCYNIPSLVPHSVHASEHGMLLLVAGNDYRMAANRDRLELVHE